ncbi:hypothetical protein QOZ88_02935 [Blastococcus sp. BMG 814]|uniref:Baseplate assembly protein n=1 Tax=Blastococcus carthaginiensis TaxID=3050034 RepID=A0ABT9I7N5_9ACTN|nr:hypothetical protein [Blastococcus carthaginiensis]MDP5181580.1 hypothetical protein [Blastococcus carthaginiensis]
MTDCGCDPLAPQLPSTANPPAQTHLRRRVATHATALARMRTAFGADGRSPQLRALARQSAEDPAVALLDAWAVVCDVVAFYSERIAEEGFLRTATERRSIRELARTLGYELRPGVSAQVELAFTGETAPGAPAAVTVPRGTPVQSVPGQGEQPQTFETAEDLEVRGAWNDIPLVDAEPQHVAREAHQLWLRGPTTSVRPGGRLLVVRGTVSRLRVVDGVEPEPAGHAGWTRLRLVPATDTGGAGEAWDGPTEVYAFGERASLFGWNAPDPNLLVTEHGRPAGSEHVDSDDADQDLDHHRWMDFGVDPYALELDGDRPSVRAGTDAWVAVEQPAATDDAPPILHAAPVTKVVPDGAQRYALSGRITRVLLAGPRRAVPELERRRAVVHCASWPLPAQERPRTGPVAGTELEVHATDPPLPVGRSVLVVGVDAAEGQPQVQAATVTGCTPSGERRMRLELDRSVTGLRPDSVRVRGNVVPASHGETVRQVLGSGDGRVSFPCFRPRRAPLTHVRSTTTPEGAAPELEVRVDGVLWERVPRLDTAGPQDRVYVVRHDEDGGADVVFGDGLHGARLPTGEENVSATYRVGIGAPGAVGAGQLSLLVRRPLGVRQVENPAPAADWAPPEELEQARVNAPVRVRTLDRAVSVADHEDLARGYAGVGPARADLVWDGRRELVVVTLLGTDASAVSAGLRTDVHAALAAVRDPGTPLEVRAGQVLPFGLSVAVRHDPAHERAAVEDRVRAALTAAFGPAVRTFASPVSSAAVLVVVRQVPGVLACTVPRLEPPPDHEEARVAEGLLTAAPARWHGGVQAAQLLALDPDGLVIGEMTQ